MPLNPTMKISPAFEQVLYSDGQLYSVALEQTFGYNETLVTLNSLQRFRDSNVRIPTLQDYLQIGRAINKAWDDPHQNKNEITRATLSLPEMMKDDLLLGDQVEITPSGEMAWQVHCRGKSITCGPSHQRSYDELLAFFAEEFDLPEALSALSGWSGRNVDFSFTPMLNGMYTAQPRKLDTNLIFQHDRRSHKLLVGVLTEQDGARYHTITKSLYVPPEVHP